MPPLSRGAVMSSNARESFRSRHKTGRHKIRTSWSRFVVNLLILAVCDLIWVWGLARFGGGSISELVLLSLVDCYAAIGLLLAYTMSSILVPKKLRTVWLVGLIAPLAMLGVFSLFSLID